MKVFKKGDLYKCNSWRGVTLLPVTSKIFCRMLLEQIQKGVDKKLQKDQQAGFQPKRSTTEQIFLLTNILEQESERRVGLYAHFVDFEKAFDSVHRESLWNIMRSYGIPDKMVRVTVGIYAGFECAKKSEKNCIHQFIGGYNLLRSRRTYLLNIGEKTPFRKIVVLAKLLLCERSSSTVIK